MFTCRRCGLDTVRFTVDQRYCSICARDVAAAVAPRSERWVPVWMRNCRAKSLNGLPT